MTISNTPQQRYPIAKEPCRYCSGPVTWSIKIDNRFPAHVTLEGFLLDDGRCPKFKKLNPQPAPLLSSSGTNLDNGIGSEFYLVNQDRVPPLYAYEIKHGSMAFQKVAGKLAYQSKTRFGGHWTTADYRIISDKKVYPAVLEQFLKELWNEDLPPFKMVRSIAPDTAWSPSSLAIATFVARELVSSDLQKQIDKALDSESRKDKKDVNLRIEADVRPWVVDCKPVVSISISTSIESKVDLKTYTGSAPQ
nr:hypothetical protein [Candidatus Sigynarchaeota archaeon]